MYNVVVRVVLMYGRKILVVMETMMTVIEVFYDRIVRHIIGMR